MTQVRRDTPTATSTAIPTFTDAIDGAWSSTNQDSGSLVNYYFVFLALIIIIAGLSGFLVYRKRRRAMATMRHSREHALARDLSTWNSGGGSGDGGGAGARSRGYWPRRETGRDEDGLEEGLNELGEAPPAYMPRKSREDTTRDGPAIPLQALPSEEDSHKPPEYGAEAHARPIEAPEDGSGEGSSRAGQADGDTTGGATRT